MMKRSYIIDVATSYMAHVKYLVALLVRFRVPE
jgi:hypothetical protein